jgi:hypothetical protein
MLTLLTLLIQLAQKVAESPTPQQELMSNWSLVMLALLVLLSLLILPSMTPQQAGIVSL